LVGQLAHPFWLGPSARVNALIDRIGHFFEYGLELLASSLMQVFERSLGRRAAPAGTTLNAVIEPEQL
jgi:hypothetical protein